MSRLVINNRIITTPIIEILRRIKIETNDRFLKEIKNNSKEIIITCPFHKNGNENHPSCFVHNDVSDDTYGVYHCFTCNSSGTFSSLVSYCLDMNIIESNEWLIENFSSSYLVQDYLLPEIQLDNKSSKVFLDEKEIEKYKYIHPYVLGRGISEDIIKRFSVGWDEKNDYITFPCWDEHDNLIGIFKRSVKSKHFIIPSDIDKPIYLLNFLIKENITTAYVVESCFNALSLWTWGYPAICLFGTGSKEQYEILKKSGIRNYVLCFDGDAAGQKGRDRFIKNMNTDSFISYKILPAQKDVNDLTKEEFEKLELICV